MTVSTDYTTHETIILDVLSDGHRHLPSEICRKIDPELPVSKNALAQSVLHLKKKLRDRGETIICESYLRRFYYRHVKLITAGD